MSLLFSENDQQQCDGSEPGLEDFPIGMAISTIFHVACRDATKLHELYGQDTNKI